MTASLSHYSAANRGRPEHRLVCGHRAYDVRAAYRRLRRRGFSMWEARDMVTSVAWAGQFATLERHEPADVTELVRP